MKKYFRKILLWLNIAFALALIGSYLANHLNPEYFWYFAFFGLAYPVLLLINFGFIILWLWRRKWYLFISLIVILAGWGNVGKILQLRLPGKHREVTDAIKLMSYNIRLFNYYHWEKGEFVGDSILNFILKQDVDMVCFQEFLTTHNVPFLSEEHIDTVLKTLPYKHIFYSYKTHENSNYGLATYSKYPVVKKSSVRFKNSYNSFIYTDIKLGDDTVRFFNVHLQSIKLRRNNYLLVDSPSLRIDSRHITEVKDISGRLKLAYIKRAQQVDELNWYIRQSPYPVVVCGDFNDTPVSYTYSRIKGKLSDAFLGSGEGIGSTYRGISPSFRIDFIFHSRTMRSSVYKTHSVAFSDHSPISCKLELNSVE